MYQKIEREFKEESMYRKYQTLYLIAYIVFFLIFLTAAFGIVFKFNINNFINLSLIDFCYIIIVEIIALFIFYILIYFYLVVISRKDPEFTIIKALTDHEAIISLFWDQIYAKDMNVLIKILKKYSINTRPKTLEAIRHYQVMIPRKIETSIQLVSVIALATSLIALIFNDKLLNSFENMAIALILFISIIIFYLAFCKINKTLLKMFGKSELFKRLELSLSEIYMRCLIK